MSWAPANPLQQIHEEQSANLRGLASERTTTGQQNDDLNPPRTVAPPSVTAPSAITLAR